MAGWKAGAKRKTKPVSRRHADAAAGSSRPDAEGLEHVGPPTVPDAARFPCFATGTPAAATTSAPPSRR